MEGEDGDVTKTMIVTSFGQVIFQILLMDLVFSIDSIITAVGMVKSLGNVCSGDCNGDYHAFCSRTYQQFRE